jgi:sugar lactone lactonase YvrE
VRRTLLVLSGALFLSASIAIGAGGGGSALQDRIDLPNGWQPEGVASGQGKRLFVGSIPTGAVFRVNARTGEGEVAVPAAGGRSAIGLKANRRERLYVAGGETGQAFSYNGKTGADRGSLQLAPPGETTFVNDVTLAPGTAYFTDSERPVLYAVERDMSSVEELELRGFKPRPGIDLNGIVDARRGRTLIAVQMNVGRLWRIDAHSGKARKIGLGGDKVVNGDGLLLRGRKLYVVQNQDNQIAVVRLERNLKRGEVVRRIRDEDFDVPTTIAAVGRSLYVANARFGTDPTPDTEYWLTRVGR